MNTEKLHELCARLRPLAKKYRAALIVLLAGVLLLVSGGREEKTDATQTQTDADSFSLSDFETQLCRRLSAIDGAGRVELMLSLEQTGEAVYAVNTRETGGAASSRESDVAVISSSGYGETPVTVKNVLPTFRGAIVLCDGAENAAGPARGNAGCRDGVRSDERPHHGSETRLRRIERSYGNLSPHRGGRA